MVNYLSYKTGGSILFDMNIALLAHSSIHAGQYQHELSVKLQKCKIGCMVGDRCVNHVMYADDLIVVAGLQQLLRVCTNYGVQYNDI